jgi:hypothetical protein
MPSENVQFANETLVLPGVYSNQTSNAPVAAGTNVQNPLIFIAYGFGGAPYTAITTYSASQLQQVMRGSPSASFANFLYNGGSSLPGASTVIYINASDSTQSSSVITSTGGINLIDLTSTDYGIPSNLLSFGVAAGSVSPGINLLLSDGYAKSTITGYNLGVPFQLAYTGTAVSGVSYTISATEFELTSPNSGESYVLPLSSFPTVTSLVNFINATGVYSASVISSTSGQLNTTGLDFVSAVALPVPVISAGITTYTYINVTATLGDVIYWINNFAQTYATAALASTATPNTPITYQITPNVLFSGATTEVPVVSDYASALTTAFSIPASIVFIDNNALNIQVLGVQHARQASLPVNGMPRRFITGLNTGATPAQAISLALQFNSRETSLVFNEIYQVSQTTNLPTLYSGLYTAASVAGMMQGNPPFTPMTNKQLNAVGVGTNLSTSTINSLQQAGVMVVNLSRATNLPVVISDLTTWNNDNNPTNVYNQQVAIGQQLNLNLIKGLDSFVGQVTNGSEGASLLNALKKVLNQAIALNLLISWQPLSLTAVYNPVSQAWALTAQVMFVGQTRFVTIQLNISPTQISITG